MEKFLCGCPVSLEGKCIQLKWEKKIIIVCFIDWKSLFLFDTSYNWHEEREAYQGKSILFQLGLSLRVTRGMLLFMKETT